MFHVRPTLDQFCYAFESELQDETYYIITLLSEMSNKIKVAKSLENWNLVRIFANRSLKTLKDILLLITKKKCDYEEKVYLRRLWLYL
jgi:hypothetical protein